MSVMDRRPSDGSVKQSPSTESSQSVEEMFQTLSIKDIQTLNRQYQQDAVNTRSELQSLVSNKYRDLIAITNQITETYESTKTFETALSDLAFKSSNFVKFNSQNYSNIHHKLSADTLTEIQKGESTRIANDIVYDKLLYLDCQLQKLNYEESPFLHTSNYIYFAKIYYILNNRFNSEIRSNKLLLQTYNTMKANFKKFLHLQIATYNASRSLFNESDKSVLVEPFTKKHLISVNPLSEHIDDVEGPLEYRDHENAHDLSFHLPESFDTSSSPLVNYLLCFILLESSESSASRSTVLFDFVTLRFDYLQSLLSSITIDSTNYNKLNFYNILRYIENTFDYVAGYFENTDPKNPLVKALSNITKKWDLIDDRYVDMSRFRLSIDPMLVNLQASSLKDLKDFKNRFVSLLWKLFTNLPSGGSDVVGQLSENLVLFKVLLMSLKKLELSCADVGSRSQVIKLVSEGDLLDGILKQVTSICETSYDLHLATFDALLDVVKQKQETRDVGHSLFTTDFVNMINTDLTNYYDLITKASMNFTLSFDENVVDSLDTWFNKSHDFFVLLDTGSEPNKHSFSLSDLSDRLSMETEINWGKFNKKKLLDEFSSLRSRLMSRFWSDFDRVYGHLSSMVDEVVKSNDISGVYFLIKVLISLKQNLQQLKLDEKKANEKILELREQLVIAYNHLLSSVIKTSNSPNSTISFIDQFEAVVNVIVHHGVPGIDADTSDMSLQLLKLNTLIFRFSSTLLNHGSHSYEQDYKTGVIFTDKENIFAQQKNKWVEEVLINKIYKQLESSKLDKQQTLRFYACVTFLSFLVSQTPEVPVERLQNVTEEGIEDSDLTAVYEDIREFYNASKNTYYPLNL